MCTPLFVRVDFIRMKKDLSKELSGARRLGLLDSTGKQQRHTDFMIDISDTGIRTLFTKNKNRQAKVFETQRKKWTVRWAEDIGPAGICE